MVQPEANGFAGAEARLLAQRQLVPLVADYLLHGGDEDPAHEIVSHVIADAELVNKGLEAAGGLIQDGVVDRMARVLRSARAVQGLAAEPQTRQSTPYSKSDEQAFRQAKRNNQASRA